MLVAAMQKAGTVEDVGKIRAALLSSTYSGIWTIKYDQNGEQIFDFDIAHMKKGGEIKITRVEP
jgi:branched-chain amino acid transport system substrate-binding protein